MKVTMYVVGNPVPVAKYTWLQKYVIYIPDFGHMPRWRDLENIPKQEILDSLNDLSLKGHSTAFANKEDAIRAAKTRSTGIAQYEEPIAKSCPVFTVQVDFGLNKITDFQSFEIYVNKHIDFYDDGPIFSDQPDFSYALNDYEDDEDLSTGLIQRVKRLEFPNLEIQPEDEKDLLIEFAMKIEMAQKEVIEALHVARNQRLQPTLEQEEVQELHDARLAPEERERIELSSSLFSGAEPIVLSRFTFPQVVVETQQAEQALVQEEFQKGLDIAAQVPPLVQKNIVQFM